MTNVRAPFLVIGSAMVVLVTAAAWFGRGLASGAGASAPRPPVARIAEPAAQQSDRHILTAPFRDEAEGAEAVAPNESNARRLTRLAETSQDPAVVEASFAAMLTTYAARSTRKPGPDADLERAVVKHVRSERPSTAVAALQAARIALMAEPPRAGVANAVVELAAPDQAPARRYAALEALNLLRPNRRDEGVLLAFERALDARQPELVSLALLALSQSRASFEAAPPATQARLGRRVVALLGHYEPGVRGHALLALSEIPALAALDARYQAAERAVLDREPFVRARAADLLARCGEPMAIHVLVERVGDLAPARHELGGWTALDGSPGVLVHEVPGRSRVAEAALFAVRALGELVSASSALELTLGGRPTSDAAVLENAELAKAWYRVERERIPTTARSKEALGEP